MDLKFCEKIKGHLLSRSVTSLMTSYDPESWKLLRIILIFSSALYTCKSLKSVQVCQGQAQPIVATKSRFANSKPCTRVTIEESKVWRKYFSCSQTSGLCSLFKTLLLLYHKRITTYCTRSPAQWMRSRYMNAILYPPYFIGAGSFTYISTSLSRRTLSGKSLSVSPFPYLTL